MIIRVALAFLLALPAVLSAAPQDSPPRPDIGRMSAHPSYIRAVAPAAVGIYVEVPRDRPSVATLGSERWGSGVIFDATTGYALTVSYILLDADRIEVSLRDGRRVAAKLVGLDLEVGLGVVKLQGPGPWPAASFGDSAKVAVGDITGTVGVAEDGGLVATVGRVEAVQPFTASWEYMLDRAFVVSPYNAAFGGGALVDVGGRVIGITSLRLGDAPYANLAIPIEKFLPGKDELCNKGRVASRRPRPWLGLYTLAHDGGGVIVTGVSPFGPAGAAGIRRGDVITRLNGEKVGSQEDFYTRLWQGAPDQEVQLVIRRASGATREAVTVRPADRYRVFRTSDR
ncbi:MAG TPA: S1C family serine protease [Candidatus Methylomirabilis sp.]|nr:S1C family serine protease [Candidatus Methylomirabilis sp.]